MTRLPLLFFLFIFFMSCGNRVPDGVLDKEKMVSVLTDVHLADGYIVSFNIEERKSEVSAVYKAVYKKHNTDSIQIRKSLAYYSERPAVLEMIYTEIDSNINRALIQENKMVVLRQKQEQEKALLEQEILQRKEKYRMDSLAKLNGQYNFGLPEYFSAIDYYLTIYRSLPTLNNASPTGRDVPPPPADTLKRDSLKRID